MASFIITNMVANVNCLVAYLTNVIIAVLKVKVYCKWN